MKKILSLLMLLVAIVSGAWAGTEPFSMASKWGSQPFTKTQNGITVTFSENEKSGSQNGYIKFVKGQTMTISSTVGNITALAFTSDGTYYGKAAGTTVNTGTITGAGTADISWAGNASEIIISNDADKGGDWRVASIVVTYSDEPAPASGPTITAQPTNAAFVIGTSDYPVMSVEATASAGSLKYQWKYSNDGENFEEIGKLLVPSAATATLSGEEAISVFQPTEPTTIYLKCSVTDDNGTVDSDVATLSIVNGTAPTISVAADKTVALKGGKITLTATITGTPDPTIQWYSKSGELIVPIEGATSTEYTPATTAYGTFEYLAKATNSAGTADSDPITVTVKPALQSVKFSNGVYGAIIEPATAEVNGNIEVPYINYGETPEIDETSWTAFNDTEAEISTEENVVTVISGAYSATYNYEFIPVNPIEATADIASTNFTNVPDWVFNKYGYDETKGLKFAKAVDEADNLRIAKGNTRQYYFVGPAKSLTLTQVGTKRNVNVYVNGESVKTDVSNDAIGAIALSGTKDNIVIIEAAEGTKGDGGFSAYTIAACDVKPEITTQPVNVVYEVGSTTYPTMSVEATGAGAMKYLWEFSTIGDAQTFQSFPSSVPSAATATLSGEEVINALNNTDAGVQPGIYYARCRVTDDNGTAYSDEATLTIKAPNTPNITTQPQNVTYVIGSETCDNMTIVAEPATEGDPLTYMWQYSLNGETFNDIPALFVPSAITSTLIGNEAIALINNLDPKPEQAFIRCIVSETGATDAISNVATVTLQAPASYSESVNIEQLVLDNGVNYDIANEFVKKYIEYASLNALDSLNDADGKFMRNEPFLGLKLKTSGAYIKVTLKQGSSLKVKLGNIGDNVKVNINGTDKEDIVKMTTKDEGYMTTVYEYTADDADAVVTFTTSSASTVVFKQIMIDEEIAQVILPYAVDMPEAAANGTVEMPASANPGDVVTIVATPAEGYELDAITVTGKSSNTAYEVSADNTFTMPDENVNVTVTFKQITGINGIAEDAAVAENANVKVIKNGNLYIGKFNIAGQQVK